MIRPLGLLMLVSVVATGCAVSLIEPKPTTIDGTYTVQPQIKWASVPARKGLEVWTVDGPALEAVTFVKGLGDGEALMKGPIPGAPDEDKRPKFRAQMTPSEIVELVTDSYVLFGAQKLETSSLRPAKFDTTDGFRFDIGWVTRSGLEMQASAAGAVVKGKLQMIIYSGARAHYFPKYRDDIERVFGSVKLL